MAFPGEQLLIKLWDTLIDNGVGNLLKPWQIRREAKAQAEQLLILAEADKLSKEVRQGKRQVVINTKTQLIGDQSVSEIEPPAELTNTIPLISAGIRQEQFQKEINIAKSILQAEEILKDSSLQPPVSEIDEDWIIIWRDNAGKSSKEYVQTLWGKVLAGEFKTPGMYSLRTLEFLKTLSVTDAKFIEEKFTFVIGNRFIIQDETLLNKLNFTLDHRLILQELGLIAGAEGTLHITLNGPNTYNLISHNKCLRLIPTGPKSIVNYQQCPLTALGREIAQLSESSPNHEYLVSIANYAKNNGFKVIKYDHDLSTYRLTNGIEI